MNIRFLGTGFGAPYGGRHQQSIMIEIGSNSYLFDCGAPVADILQDYDKSKIKAVFISHLHGDHLNGINDLINLAEFFGMRFDLYLSEKRGIDTLKAYTLMQLQKDSDLVDFHLIERGDFYDDGALKVTAYQTDHMKGLPCYAFLIEAEGKRVFVTGDLCPTLEDLPTIIFEEKTELIITEGAHFEADFLVEKMKRTKAEKIAFVHVMPPKKYEDIRLCAKESGIVALYPDDGDSEVL